jgi:hypothetical protein
MEDSEIFDQAEVDRDNAALLAVPIPTAEQREISRLQDEIDLLFKDRDSPLFHATSPRHQEYIDKLSLLHASLRIVKGPALPSKLDRRGETPLRFAGFGDRGV